jgi:hypothetical protein
MNKNKSIISKTIVEKLDISEKDGGYGAGIKTCLIGFVFVFFFLSS